MALICVYSSFRLVWYKCIGKQHPFYAVFRDSSMGDDSVAANFEQIFATYSPETVRKVL